jgi:hypothetical protein
VSCLFFFFYFDCAVSGYSTSIVNSDESDLPSRVRPSPLAVSALPSTTLFPSRRLVCAYYVGDSDL